MEYQFKTPSGETTLVCSATKEAFETRIGDTDYTVSGVSLDEKRMQLVINGKAKLVHIEEIDGGKCITIDGVPVNIFDAGAVTHTGPAQEETPGDVTPPMPSVVVSIAVEPGQSVSQGTALITLSAMKMETTLSAPFDAVVTAINTEPGAQVMPGEILVALEPHENDDHEPLSATGTS